MSKKRVIIVLLVVGLLVVAIKRVRDANDNA
jgi:hypothetical protein